MKTIYFKKHIEKMTLEKLWLAETGTIVASLDPDRIPYSLSSSAAAITNEHINIHEKHDTQIVKNLTIAAYSWRIRWIGDAFWVFDGLILERRLKAMTEKIRWLNLGFP